MKIKYTGKDKSATPIWVPVIVIGVLLIFTCAFGYLAFKDSGKELVEVEATITDIVTKGYGDDQSHTTYIEYTVDGIKYEDSLSEWASTYKVGGKINVLYEKGHPENLIGTKTSGVIGKVIFFGLLVGMIIAIVFMTKSQLAQSKLKKIKEMPDTVRLPGYVYNVEYDNTYLVNGCPVTKVFYVVYKDSNGIKNFTTKRRIKEEAFAENKQSFEELTYNALKVDVLYNPKLSEPVVDMQSLETTDIPMVDLNPDTVFEK